MFQCCQEIKQNTIIICIFIISSNSRTEDIISNKPFPTKLWPSTVKTDPQLCEIYLWWINVYTYNECIIISKFCYQSCHDVFTHLSESINVITVQKKLFNPFAIARHLFCYSSWVYVRVNRLCAFQIVKTHMANFSVCHAYYEVSVVMVSFSHNCTIIIIGVCRPPDKSNIPEFTIKLNDILSSTSQSDHVFIVGTLILTF